MIQINIRLLVGRGGITLTLEDDLRTHIYKSGTYGEDDLKDDLETSNDLFVVYPDFFDKEQDYLRWVKIITEATNGASRVLCVLNADASSEHVLKVIEKVGGNYVKGDNIAEISERIKLLANFLPVQSEQETPPVISTQVVPYRHERLNQDIFWELLIDQIKDGDIIPVIGPAIGDPPVESPRKIARRLSELLKYPLTEAQEDLPAVANYARWSENRYASHGRLAKEIDKINNNSLAEDHPISLLARIPFRGYITTTYDSLLFGALQRWRQNDGLRLVKLLYDWNPAMDTDEPTLKQRIQEFNTKCGGKLSARRFYTRYIDFLAALPEDEHQEKHPFVFYLHGSSEIPESMVVTEMDYVQFLINQNTESRSILPAGKRKFLFIGHRLTDWGFRFSFRSLFYEHHPSFQPPKDSRIVAEVPVESITDEARRSAIIGNLNLYFHRLGMEAVWENPTTFVQELYERYEASK